MPGKNDVMIFKAAITIAWGAFWSTMSLVDSYPPYTVLFSKWWLGILGLGIALIWSFDYILKYLETSPTSVKVHPISYWRPLAIAEIKRHYNLEWDTTLIRHEQIVTVNNYYFKAGCFLSVPAGELWVESRHGDRQVCFIDVRVGAENLVVSPLHNIDWHFHATNTQSIIDCATTYIVNKKERFIGSGTHHSEIERTQVEVVST